MYTASTNKLASVSWEKVFNFSYDSNGNTTVENTKQYIYNQDQRLIKIMQGSNVLGEYVYNGHGQRVKKITNNGNRCAIFHYNRDGLLITETTSSGTIKAEYIYLNGQPLAKIENNVISYLHNDHLGTSMMMTDDSGSTVWQGELRPFGEATVTFYTITSNLRFPGQYCGDRTEL